MKRKCSKCKNDAVTYIRYNGTHLCKVHFIQYYANGKKNHDSTEGKLENNKKIGIAVSGGKDSIVCLHLINKFFSKRKDFEIIVLTVDEGIENYRNISLK